MSQWSTFTKCGEQFRLEKVARAPQRPAAWFAQGIAFHSAAELWELSERESSPDDVVDYYTAEYDRLIDEGKAKEPDLARWLTGGRTRADDDISRRRERGADQVRTYMTYALGAPEKCWTFQGDPAVEVEFELDLDGIKVIGFIDNLPVWPDGRVTVRDWKTGSKRPEWEFQLGVYALAVEELTGYRPRWGDFWMAKDGRPDKPVDLSVFTRDRVTRWFKNADTAIRLGLFNPNPGDACRTCGVSDFCQALGARANEYPPN
ncbi:PD-(D/E)XK nuclease family protein [Catellatospora sichuanensis]|uniref:PD-(D/E)XK nuclease family protein n=1 Tax=Catellatospora sichuanensis TaxID=1969805 RepID=UPI003CCC46DF